MSVSPGSHLSALALGEEAQQDPLRSPEKMSDQAPDAEAELPSLLIRSGNSYYLEPAYNKPANQRPSLNILLGGEVAGFVSSPLVSELPSLSGLCGGSWGYWLHWLA